MNPLIPMLAITGKPTQERMEEIFDWYRQIDIDQVMLYPRSGCEFEYPSKEWYEFCVMFIKCAAERQLKVWIYDDFNWPSAQMNGKLVQDNPKYASKYLKFDNKYEFEICENADFADLLDDECTTEFIQRTHQKYYELVGEYFGNTVLGFFTDEPSFSYSVTDEPGAAYCAGEQNIVHTMLPYYEGISEDYMAEFGRDLYDDIKSNNNYLENYYLLLGRRYRKNFIDKINNFCVSHGVVFTGHMLDESVVCGSVQRNGNLLDTLSGMSLPAIDEIYTYTTPDMIEWETLGAERYATRNGKHGLIEVFALGPTDMPLAKWKQMINLVSFFGLDHYVLAVTAVDARGNSIKNAYFNPHNYMQPFWPAFKTLGEVAKKAVSMAKRKAAAQVQVIYPATLSASYLLDSKKCEEFDHEYRTCLQKLTENQIDWEIINESDVPTASIVISADDFKNVEKIIANIPQKYPYITDRSGKKLNHILIKRFVEGGFAALNLNDDEEDTKVIVHMETGQYETVLYSRELITEKDIRNREYVEVVSVNTDYELELNNNNTIRAHTVNGPFEFSCEKDTLVRITAREYKRGSEVMLDGKKVELEKDCDTLIDGFRQLYKCSEETMLKAGKHIITSDMQDFRYLPAVFINGKFGSNGTNIFELDKRINTENLNDILHQYAGSFNLKCKIDIPKSDKQLYLSGEFGGMYVTVKINGSIAGEIISKPYLVPIEQVHNGTVVDVEFRIHTPVSKMLGDVTKYNEAQPLGWSEQYEHIVNPGKYSKLIAKNIKILAEQ